MVFFLSLKIENIGMIHSMSYREPATAMWIKNTLFFFMCMHAVSIELNGHRCRTRYILIKATKNILQVKSNQGIVHGNIDGRCVMTTDSR